jgi:hypothetical protein
MLLAEVVGKVRPGHEVEPGEFHERPPHRRIARFWTDSDHVLTLGGWFRI